MTYKNIVLKERDQKTIEMDIDSIVYALSSLQAKRIFIDKSEYPYDAENATCFYIDIPIEIYKNKNMSQNKLYYTKKYGVDIDSTDKDFCRLVYRTCLSFDLLPKDYSYAEYAEYWEDIKIMNEKILQSVLRKLKALDKKHIDVKQKDGIINMNWRK